MNIYCRLEFPTCSIFTGNSENVRSMVLSTFIVFLVGKNCIKPHFEEYYFCTNKTIFFGRIIIFLIFSFPCLVITSLSAKKISYLGALYSNLNFYSYFTNLRTRLYSLYIKPCLLISDIGS